MESLIQRQSDIIELIKQIERNFSKDSARRKTRTYLDERLDTLDKLWAEFQSNNDKLAHYENDIEPYFKEDQYSQSRIYFDSVRSKIHSFPAASGEEMQPKSPVYCSDPVRLRPAGRGRPCGPPGGARAPGALRVHVHGGPPSKVADLLSQQRTNFRAFNRMVKNIKVDEIRDKWELEDELKNIQSRWSTIDTLHLQIDNYLQGSDSIYDEEFGIYENTYRSIKRDLNLKLASTAHLQQSTPRIDIPVFSGSYTQWPTFFDLYVESIHNNNLLSKCQKMQHLKGKLRGDAERLIQHLHISSENYDAAWDLLTHRYNNQQLLFTKHIEAFLNQPIVQKQTSFEIRRLYDTTMECLHAIQNLGIDTSTWDPLLVHLISKKLDIETYGDYKEARKSPRDLPSLSELMEFLEGKFTALEPIHKKERDTTSTTSNRPYQQNKPFYQYQGGNRSGKFPKRELQAIATCTWNCPLCNNSHALYKCNKFVRMTPEEKLITVIKLHVCQNCLYKHYDNPCVSTKRCKQCQNTHNTILHDAYTNVSKMPPRAHNEAAAVSVSNSTPVHTVPTMPSPSTSRQDNKQHSVNHVATDDEEILLTTLSLKIKSIDGRYITLRALLDQGSQISLISENAAQLLGLPRQRYHASVSGIGNGSKQGKGTITLDCRSIHDDYGFTTQALVIKHVINNLPNMTFNQKPWDHLQHIKLADPQYNVSRPIDLLLDASIYSNIIMSGLIKGPNMAPIAQQTRMGWILSGSVKTFNCHVVVNNLSDISQYWELEEINNQPDDLTQDEQYCEEFYQSTTRRLEDGRYEVAIPMKPNFEEKLGQSKSKDLQSLILGWRQHKYVITADIEKMFRQINVRESDQHLQRIVWRESPQEALKEYQLSTIVFGLKAAPYMAMRTLKQLAIDEADKYPLASRALMTSFYMDDLLEGASTIEEAKQLQKELIDILGGAGMNIRKWSSNTAKLTEGLSAEQLDTPLDFKSSESRKTLGIRWNPTSDTFTFQKKYQSENNEKRLTKRELLSKISVIFDPLGWLSPLTIRAKLLFQQTWSEEPLDWDGLLPESLNNDWEQLKQDLQHIDHFEIPRYLGDKSSYQIHGFCDASEKAFACSIYITTHDSKGEFTSTLMTAKTKLSPLKTKPSLPRLELCSALLLSRLMEKVMETISDNTQIFAWTDSMVVLGWIHGDINRWKPFVANRIRSILEIIPATCWHHVKSEENAADCATRGVTAAQLYKHPLWWNGPAWLSTFEAEKIKENKYQPPTIEIKKNNVNAALCHKNDLVDKLINECSSLHRVATTIAWLSRYIKWLQNKQQVSYKNYLSTAELQQAQNLIDKSVQSVEFEEDLSRLSKKENMRTSSKLLSLNPFIDTSDGLLKVGGRLNNSSLSHAAKHPIILPSHSRLTELIVQQAHSATLHGGPSLTLSYIRDRYWILSGLRTVKRELRKCVKCRRFNSEQRHQIMADLPEPRVTPSRPFTYTGIDFTGHFDIKANKGRGVRTHKGYVAVFVCLSTKAVHLELVSDLSTPGFLAAYRRFCARRSTPRCMFSDRGSNFIGANRLLQKEYKEILQTINEDLLSKISSEYHTQWKFNAPAYPSAGGLWEAAVKSLKYHLKRVIGEQKLTYEEFITLLHQIEACLNSRPLISLSESPDGEYLSPGHFLVGGSLITRPQTDPEQMNLTTRWRLIQSMNKQFWKKWSSDYLQQLQIRTKWRTSTKNMAVDDVVLIKDDNLPPGKWALGKIVAVHPGQDGHVRVATVKTKGGIIKRPILKLALLPVREEHATSQISDVQCTTPTTDDVTTADSQADAPDQVTTPTVKASGRPKRTTRKGICHYISMALLLFLSMMTSAQCDCNITQFNNNMNMYFDKMYDMSIIRDDWKLIMYYNMSTYWSGLQHLEKYVYHLEEFLDSNHLSTQYQSIVYQLQHDLSEIYHYNKILKKHVTKRQKRGLINGVGYIANSLFGVLDDRFARKYEKDIEKISMNENHLLLLFKNQTSVIEAQSNILQRNEDIMNKQFGMIQKHLQEVKLANNKLLTQNNDELYIISAALSASIMISNVRRVQENLINTITDLTHGHLDAHLLPPEQLEEQMKVIYSHLPEDLTVPTDKHDYRDLYKLMKIHVEVGKSYLIIEVRIPLVSKETYELDKIISLPHQSYIIETITPYIAFNLRRDQLILLSESEVKECTHTSVNKILCSIDKLIHQVQMTQSICNISIHNKPMCRTRAVPCHELWIKLHINNRWLYSCCENCSLRIFCPDNKMTLKSLTGNGLLDIGQGCAVKSTTFSIIGHSNYMSHMQMETDNTYIVGSSILNHIVNTSDMTPFVPEDHIQDWDNLKTQIDDLKQKANEPLSIHDVHQYSVMYTVMVVVVISGAVYSLLRWRKYKRRLELTTTSIESRGAPPALPLRLLRARAPAPAPAARAPAPGTPSADPHDTWTTPTVRPRSVRLDIPSVIINSEVCE
ncbi:unnamed protein product [Plutella xylostella]|uniref:(diamondback moth) hypothetical protein n=1 Tax=Plutella xylostella TaxID=51655 RepID=A0A8S4G4Q6_PLUXY|nr:unnamed protein product [Plutella xylostella]